MSSNKLENSNGNSLMTLLSFLFCNHVGKSIQKKMPTQKLGSMNAQKKKRKFFFGVYDYKLTNLHISYYEIVGFGFYKIIFQKINKKIK